MKYLLPCSCGQEMMVETRQAGETIVCVCGSPLQIPTLLEITALESARDEAALPPLTTAWGMHNRLVLLGSIVAGLAVIALIGLNVERPVSRFSGIDPYQIWLSARAMPPVQAWDVWQDMKKGLDRRTDERYAAAMVRFHIWEGVVAGVAVIGVALIAAGMFLGKGQGGTALENLSS
jgi:hypothetical protein